MYLGIVPARAGSRRLPGKNLALLDGIPLLDYSLRAAQASERLHAVVVSTDSEAIASRARGLGASVPELRPAALSGDQSPIAEVLRHVLSGYERRAGAAIAAVVLLQPTSPLRTGTDIDRAIELFERCAADTVTSVRECREHPYWAWRRSGDAIEPVHSACEVAMDRHALPQMYSENGAIYVIKRDLVLAGRIYGDRIIPYVMDEVRSVDIDTPLDLAWAEFVLQHGLAARESS
jgi:CMP-N-acetylneuraminic acid synthetase